MQWLKKNYITSTDTEIVQYLGVSHDIFKMYINKDLPFTEEERAERKRNICKRKHVIPTEKQIGWIIRHFHNTSNSDILCKFGISHSCLHRIARQYNLKKSKNYNKKTQQHTTEKARQYWKSLKITNPQEYAKQRDIQRQNLKWDDSEKHHSFKKGESNKDRIGLRRFRESIKKGAETRKKTIERERMRYLMGLPLKTNFSVSRIIKQTPDMHKRYQAKWQLKKKGYIDGGGLTIYYNDDTKRTKCEHLFVERYKFKFEPEPNGTKKKDVVVTPDWSDKQGGFAV